MRLIPVTEAAQIEQVAALADRIWHEHYDPFLGKPQIDHMLERFQSAAAISDQIAQQGYRYYLMSEDGVCGGYAAVQAGDGKLFLSKLYVDARCRGRGWARQTLAFLERLCRENGLSAIWLTVNRHNTGSIAAYARLGFVRVREQVADIGGGYVMDDLVLEKPIR